MYFKINNIDFSNVVSSLKVGYETLVSDQSGRNANGDMTIDVLKTKRKVYVEFRHMTDKEMLPLLAAMNDYVVTVSYRDPKTNGLNSITGYTGTPEPDYYTIQPNVVIYKPMNLNFIEL
jgi:hypothetical protein